MTKPPTPSTPLEPTGQEPEEAVMDDEKKASWLRYRFRHRWLPHGYWAQKRREFRCWVKSGHDLYVHGGAGGWEVTTCVACGAKRVGPGNFFSTEWTADPESESEN